MGSAARLSARRYGALPLVKLKDVLYLWPTVDLYIALVRRYRKAARSLSLWQEIVRRVDGDRQAERFHTTWESQDSQASQDLALLGCVLNIGSGLWALDHLHTASRPGLPESKRSFSRDKILHATRTLSERLREFRQRERADWDTAALFEAAATAGPAVQRHLSAFTSRIAQRMRGEGIEPLLLELPYLSIDAIQKRARSALRAAYVAAAPHREATVTSLRPSLQEDDEETDDEFLARKGALAPDFANAVIDRLGRRTAEDVMRRRIRSELTERQHSTVMAYWQALAQGYTRSSKLGHSLRQYWGVDYGSRQRMLLRVRRDHPDLLSEVEKLAL